MSMRSKPARRGSAGKTTSQPRPDARGYFMTVLRICQVTGDTNQAIGKLAIGNRQSAIGNHLESPPRADVAEKARRERLLRHLESANTAHPLELAKYSLERAGASAAEVENK